MRKFSLLLMVCLMAFSTVVFAQEVVPAQGVIDQVLGFLKPLIEAAAGKYGVVIAIFSVIGMLRVVFKPVMTVVQTVVTLTPSVADDTLLASIMGSSPYKVASYLLDWTASIKLPQKK